MIFFKLGIHICYLQLLNLIIYLNYKSEQMKLFSLISLFITNVFKSFLRLIRRYFNISNHARLFIVTHRAPFEMKR